LISHPCPQCGDPAAFSKKRSRYFCAECELEFDATAQAVEPQTIFLSYAHRSEREEDFDVSEELVLLIQAELQRDGHTVWIDKDGIRSGSQWRERITSAILDHAHFLSFLSVRSVRDPGVCLNEIATALGASKNIQTVLAQDERRVAPPLTISHIQWHDFQHWREIRAGTKTGPMGEDWDAWFGQRMAGVRETLTSAQNARVNGELQKLRDILDPRTFEARIVEKTANFHGRQWLFDAAQDWLDNSTSRMFWLKGSPGVGKSAFAAKLAHQARSAVIGFFMCDFQGRKDPEDSAREVICTLAFQMASRLPDYRLKLLYQQRVDSQKIASRTADELFEFLICDPLNRSGKIPESIRLCLVIDGLDEAGRNNGGNALAELLVKHADRLPDWLGILVTSRPEPYLEQMLKPLAGLSFDGQSEHNRLDLANWIRQQLPPDWSEAERRVAVDLVLDKCGGTFLYLELVAKDPALSLSRPHELPDKLDGFFKQNFMRYFPDPAAYGESTEPFLRLLAAAPGPMPARMAQQVLRWNPRQMALHVTEPMGSLLQDRSDGWVFFHASLADWLADPARSGTHCLAGSAAGQLGDFVWAGFLAFEGCTWKAQVVDWLAQLTPFTRHWDVAADLVAAARFLEMRRRYLPARSLRLRVLDLATEDGQARADALCALADNYTESSLGDGGRPHYVHAIELLEAAWQLRREHLGDAHRVTLLTLARIPYGEAGRYVEGGKALQAVLAHADALAPADLRRVQAHYAYYLYEEGQFDASAALYRQVLAHPGLSTLEEATAHSLVGFVAHEAGHFEAGREATARAMALLEDLRDQPEHLLGTLHLNLAMCLSALARHEEALRMAARAEQHFGAVMASNDPWWGALCVDLALVRTAAGDGSAGRQLADRAAQVSEEGLGGAHFEPTCAWLLQAWFCRQDGDIARAVSLTERALEVRRHTLPKGHWRLLVAEENLACLLREQGQAGLADAIVQRWAAALVLEEFSHRLSLQACVRVLCRISASQWQAGARVLARSCINLARQRCLVEGRTDFVNRLDRIVRQMDSGDQHG
jgi:tetratricopeptide (TPR) repeat protein